MQVTLENPAKTVGQITFAEIGVVLGPLTITNAARVQQLFEAIEALPRFPANPPSTPLPCLHNTPQLYHLTFWYQSVQVLEAQLHPGGCPSVTLGSNDLRAFGDTFWPLFAQDTGIDGNSLPSSLP